MKLYINFNTGSGWEEITDQIETNSLKKTEQLFNDTLKPVINTCKFSIQKDLSTTIKIVNNNDTDVKILDDYSYAWFTGKIRNNFKTVIDNGPNVIQIECVDYLNQFETKKFDSTGLYEDYSICNTSNISNSLLHQLLFEAGYESSDLDLQDILITIPFFYYEADDNIKTSTDLLLWEYGYVLNGEADGKIKNYSVFYENLVTSNTLNNTNIIKEIQIQKQLPKYESVKLIYYPIEESTNVTVFSETSNGNDANTCNIELEPGEYYAAEDDDTTVYIDYSYEDYEVIAVKNADLQITKDSKIILSEYETLPKGFKISMYNSSITETLNISQVDVTGDCYYQGDQHNIIISEISNTDDIEETEATYITSSTYAKLFTQYHANYYKYSDFTYTAKSKTDFNLGAVVDLNETAKTNLDTKVIISKKVSDSRGFFIYTLTAIVEFDASVITTEKTVTKKTDTSIQGIASKLNNLTKTAITATVPNAELLFSDPVSWCPSFIDSEQLLYVNYEDNGYIYLKNLLTGGLTQLNSVSSAYPVFIGNDQIAYVNQENSSRIYIKSINDGLTGSSLSTSSCFELAYYDGYLYFINGNDNNYLYRIDPDVGTEELFLNETTRLISSSNSNLLIVKQSEDKIYKYNGIEWTTVLEDIKVIDISPFTIEKFLYVTIEGLVYQKLYSPESTTATGDLLYDGVNSAAGYAGSLVITSAIDGALYAIPSTDDLDLNVTTQTTEVNLVSSITGGSKYIFNLDPDDISSMAVGDYVYATGIPEGTKITGLGNTFLTLDHPATLTTSEASIQIIGSRLSLDANMVIVPGTIKAKHLAASAISSKAKVTNESSENYGNPISDINLDTGKQIYYDSDGNKKLILDPATGEYAFYGDVEFSGDLESNNFVSGSAGWQLKQDGNIELNNGTFRGDLIVASDDEDRYISVGSEGIKAKDTNGAIVHDIAVDALNFTSSNYLSYIGHLYKTYKYTAIASYTESTSSGIKNISLASLTSAVSNLVNYNAIECHIYGRINNASTRTTLQIFDLGVYNSYNASTEGNGFVYQISGSSSIGFGSSSMVPLKIHNVNGVPYLSFYLNVSVSGTGNWDLDLYLSGVYK